MAPFVNAQYFSAGSIKQRVKTLLLGIDPYMPRGKFGTQP
jgi:hypothetical protein